LNKALSKGSSLVKEKVVGLQKTGETWKIITSNQSYEARIIVGADGVHSVVRRNIIAPLHRKNLGACFGYTFKGVRENSVTIKFSAKSAGYLWVIPRGDHTSIGGGTTKIELFRSLKDEVNSFVKTYYPQLERNSTWAALIPNVKDVRTLFSPVSGSNWVLVGDAAGHVSPISGSGIEYALTDGELAAQAITEGHVEHFNEAWIKNYGKNLANEARLANLIYRGPMLELYCMFAKLRTALTLRNVSKSESKEKTCSPM
jgi:flavin-dependent dehydrogenase